MWKINIDTSAGGVVEFDTSGSEQWWDQADLVKLILADNLLKELSEDIKLLPSLTVLDVCLIFCLVLIVFTEHSVMLLVATSITA